MRRLRKWQKALGHQMYPPFDKIIFYPTETIGAEGVMRYDGDTKSIVRVPDKEAIIPAHTRMEATYSPRGRGGMWVFAYTLKGVDYHYHFSAEVDLPCEFHEWRTELEHGVKVTVIQDEVDEPNFPYRVFEAIGSLTEWMWVVELNPDRRERTIFHKMELRILQEFEMDETQSFLVFPEDGYRLAQEYGTRVTVKAPFVVMGSVFYDYRNASPDKEIQVPVGAEMILEWNNGKDILVYITFDGYVYLSSDRNLLSYFGASL